MVQKLVEARSLSRMSAIQRVAVPNILRDMSQHRRQRSTHKHSRWEYFQRRYTAPTLIRAPAGAGKTLAVLIPILHAVECLKANPTGPSCNGPHALFLAPTDLACIQLYKEIAAFCADGKCFRSFLCSGLQRMPSRMRQFA